MWKWKNSYLKEKKVGGLIFNKRFDLEHPVLLQSYLNFSALVIFSQKEEIKINDWFCWQATTFFSSPYSHASQNVFKAKSSASCEKHSTIVKWVSSTFYKRAISHNKKEKLGLKKKNMVSLTLHTTCCCCLSFDSLRIFRFEFKWKNILLIIDKSLDLLKSWNCP